MERENNLIVGIPVYNDLECFKLAVRTLFESTNYPFTLVIIESGSTDGSREYADALPYGYPDRKIEVIHTPKEGPLKAYNRLFQLAKERKCDLYLTQTDTIHYKLYRRDWLDMMNQVARYPQVGAVICLNSGGISGPEYIDKFEWIGGWSSYFPHRTLKLVGDYDGNFPTGQYGVDVDHTYRIFKAGLKVICINYWIDHHMMNAREHDNHPDTEEHKRLCAEYFRKKHKLGEFKDVLVG